MTVDEFRERLDAAYLVMNVEELEALVADLPLPARPKRRRIAGGHKVMVSALAFAVAVIAVTLAVSMTVHPHAATSQPPTAPRPVARPPSTPATPSDLNIAVVTAGQSSHHDPADQCGVFTMKAGVGDETCYIVVRFTNVSASAVNFIPADLSLVYQNGSTDTIEPAVPKCYDTIDTHSSSTLTPKAHVSVHLCYPVLTGAVPQTLQGVHTLTGLAITLPRTR